MPPLSAPADRYRALASELAYLRAAPVRKGGKAERKRRARDLERALAVTVDAMRAACKAMWLAASEDERAAADKALRTYRKRNALSQIAGRDIQSIVIHL